MEYTWILNTCGRCGHLEHKEKKRCFFPAVQANVETYPMHEVLSNEARGVEADMKQVNVETVSMHEVSNEARGVETDKEQAQFSAVSDQVVVQVENSETSLVLASTDQIVEHINEIEIEQL